jgi:hypothetical protein
VPSPLQAHATVGATTIRGRYSVYLNSCSCVFESTAFCCTLLSSLWIIHCRLVVFLVVPLIRFPKRFRLQRWFNL